MAGPLIVTAELGERDFVELDALRRRHFPPERNQLPAHLTMFHALAPSLEAEARALLAEMAKEKPPRAILVSVLDLGGGVAFGIESPALKAIRQTIAERFHGCLTAQDSAGWRPHVTIQNKAGRDAAVQLRKSLENVFRPRPVAIRGLELHRYLGGPWERLGRWRFRG